MKFFAVVAVAVGVVVCLAGQARGLTINSAEVIGDGKDETRPAKEGASVSLRCTLSLTGGEEWTICQWSHIIKGQFESSGREKNFQCTTLPSPQGQTCSNHGGTHELDADAAKIRMDVSTNYCGLTLTAADSDKHDGQWECRVTGSASTMPMYSQLDLFITNQSTVRMSQPDAWSSNPEMIKYDFAQGRPEIRAICRGYGGRPAPTFRWYVTDDRRQINKNDYTASTRPGTDPIYGNYVEETITFTPTYEKLCNEYGLGSVCRPDVFTFNLICKTEQGTYYVQENNDASSQAIVEVRNNGPALTASLFLLLTSTLLAVKTSLLP